jgi:RNA polymerase sigma-70 factor, ECF subfamily
LGKDRVDWGDLMRATINGDGAAYNRLLKSLAPALRAVAQQGLSRAGMSANEAEDVVQETLLAIHLKRDTWNPSLPFAPWVKAIARNKLVDAIRRRGHRKQVSIDDFAEIIASEVSEPSPIFGKLDAYLQSLSDSQRSVVRAISLEGASIRETAIRFGMSEGAVRVALHRGLAALAAKFGKPTT